MGRKSAWLSWGLVVVCAAWLAACAGVPSSQAPATTDLLLQSGFQARPPLNAAHLQRLPAHQFVPVHGSRGTYYVYPDPGSNRLYFGSEAAYQRYKLKAAEAHAAEAQPAKASVQKNGSDFDWLMYEDAMGGLP